MNVQNAVAQLFKGVQQETGYEEIEFNLCLLVPAATGPEELRVWSSLSEFVPGVQVVKKNLDTVNNE